VRGRSPCGWSGRGQVNVVNLEPDAGASHADGVWGGSPNGGVGGGAPDTGYGAVAPCTYIYLYVDGGVGLLRRPYL